MNIFCYQHHISDFRRDTAHLTHEQKGVYRELLDAYYFSGGNLPSDIDKLSRIISVHTPSEKDALIYTVEHYFVIRSYKLTHTRADKEIALIHGKSIKAKQSVSTRWLKNKDKKPYVRNTDEILTNNQEPITIIKEPPIAPPNSGEKNVKRKRKPTTFISEDFRGDIGTITLAGKLSIDFDREQRKFIDHYLAKGEARADWQASFRTWLNRSAEFSAEREQRNLNGRQGVRDVTSAALHVIQVRQQAKAAAGL